MMDIRELHQRAMETAPPPYDFRLSKAMSEDQYKAYRTNTGHTYYLYLNALIRILRPRKVLELGTDIGRSAAFMMMSLPQQSRLITVEIGTQPRTDLELFAGDPRLSVIQGNDLDLKIYGGLDLRGIDLLYLDSDHTFEQISSEWALYRPYLSDGGCVAMDDIHLNPGMEQFWESLHCPKIDAPRDIHFSGWGLVAPFGYVREP